MRKATVIVGSLFAAIVAGLSIGPGQLSAQESETYHITPDELEQERVYSPYADRDYPNQVFFRDTHVHTNLSSSFRSARHHGPPERTCFTLNDWWQSVNRS